MKIRQGFVSNSSSTSFLIKNKSDKSLSLVDFVWENKELLDEFNAEYNGDDKLGDLINNALDVPIEFAPGEEKKCEFGDNDGPYGCVPLGRVYDYILRQGGGSENWSWRFLEFNR